MTAVTVIGGGVAGLTAAHELIERGFDVDVYERRDVVGGKARTIGVPHTGRDGRRDLPGEHGFRFFPGFYRHLDDTLSRIPFGANGRVIDRLVDTTRMAVVQPGRAPFVNVARFPRSLDDLALLSKLDWRSSFRASGAELTRLLGVLVAAATTCEARRERWLDAISFSVAARSAEGSDDYQALAGLTQLFVALRAEDISAKTTGNVALQMLRDLARPWRGADRVLDGPTRDAWLEPWREHLTRLGVRFHLGFAARRLHVERGRIEAVTLERDGALESIATEQVVLAVPVEVAARLLDAPLLAADPSLARLKALAHHTRWMVGAQFFLRRPVPSVHGHVIHLRSPWALTSVFHEQFWRPEALATSGAGDVRAVLSVDISDWDTPGHNGRPARECTRDQIRDEVWAQLREGLPDAQRAALQAEDVVAWMLDPGYSPPHDGLPSSHDEPLFVNATGSWALRPESATAIENLVLAGDYVRTHTDLASMEGANESARRAVNAVLDRTGAAVSRCAVIPRAEPVATGPLRALDAWRLARGLPWIFADAHPLSQSAAPQGAATRASTTPCTDAATSVRKSYPVSRSTASTEVT